MRRMALLRNLEQSLSGLFEGTFGRVFRTEVRPTEIARKLAREMELGKRVSLSRTYAPTDYLVYLSPDDRGRYAGVESSIAEELGAYLLEHARRERLVLVRRPVVEFHTDERLRLGEFGIEARTAPVSAQEQQRPAPPQAIEPDLDEGYADPVADEFGGPPPDADYGWEELAGPPVAPSPWVDPTLQRRPDPVADRARDAPVPSPPRRAPTTRTLVVDGTPHELHGEIVTVGRSRTCDIVVADPSVSRRHLELRRDDQGWYAVDLGSTNGSRADGEPITGARRLAPGMHLAVGHADAVIEVR